MTIDEYGYLPAAYHLVSTGDLRFSEWHTPLVNGLLGLPLIGADVLPVVPPDGTPAEGRYWFWNNGRWFEEANADPDVLAHSRLVTLDVGLALFFTLSLYAFHRYLKAPGMRRAALAGAALGLALASKFTSLVLIPVILATLGLVASRPARTDRLRGTPQAYAAAIAS